MLSVTSPRPASRLPKTSDRVRQVSIPPNHRRHLVTARTAASSTRGAGWFHPTPTPVVMAAITSETGTRCTRCARRASLSALRKSAISTGLKRLNWFASVVGPSDIWSHSYSFSSGHGDGHGLGRKIGPVSYGVATSNISSGTRYLRAAIWTRSGVTAAYAASSTARGEPGPSKRARPTR